LAAAAAAATAYNAVDTFKAGQGSTINGKDGQIATGGTNPDKTPTTRDATAADAVGLSVNISVGSSSSASSTRTTTRTARGGAVNAAGNATITARKDASDPESGLLTIQGGSVTAGNTVTLDGQRKLNLSASSDTRSEQSSDTSSSGSVGVSVGVGTISANASQSKASGQGTGNATTYNNTQIKGKVAVLNSGGDANLTGAVVQANKVQGHIQGNLIMQSLQNTDTYDASSQNSSASVSVGSTGGTGSVSKGSSSITSRYQSVGQTTSIQTGDAGFDIQVDGKTVLNGATITTTNAGLAAGNNKLRSAGGIEVKDITNTASYSADASQITLGTSAGSSSVGLGSDSDQASSITKAGVSGLAGDQSVRTGDAATTLNPIFDKATVQADVNAQVSIMSTAAQQIPKATASYAAKQKTALQNQAQAADAAGDKAGYEALTQEAAKWEEGGIYRTALHTVFGGLSGGVAGAVGAATVAGNAQNLNEMQESLRQALVGADIPPAVADALARVTFQAGVLGVGSAVGGAGAGAAAMNVDANNRQLHPTCQVPPVCIQA
jgi:filamentous hemagglutinin